MAVEKILVTTKQELESKHFGAHPAYGYDKADAVARMSGNQTAVSFYDVDPGKSNYPLHWHKDSEEIFYIISGTGVVETLDGTIPITAGSVVVCPAGEAGAHKITNTSPTEKLCYIDVDTIPPVDLAVYPKSGKFGVFTNDGTVKFYKAGAECGYYEGE